MKQYRSLLIITTLLLSSCNMPATNATPDTSVSTAAVQTIEAALANQTPLASPTAGVSINPAATGTPLASFEDVTNCRTGPGVNYQAVTQIQPGVSVEIVGFFPPNFWIVKTDKGECWVAGQFVTPAGNIGAVPIVSAVPTLQSGTLDDVSLKKWDIACNYETNEANVTIIWADKEEESGYRVVRNDIVVAELPANTTEFKETITLLAGQTVGYYVVAFNGSGSTSSKLIPLGC